MRWFMLCLWLSSSASSLIAAAQLSSTGPENFYSGETVTSIDLIANPHSDLDPLLASVVQKVGQPYSQANVEASITALEKAGGFKNVTAHVIPDISGLQLNFILESPYYLGVIKFPGMAKSLSYTRLLQVVNLQDEDPYDQARIPISAAALTRYLQNNGYFQAHVHADQRSTMRTDW